MAKTKKRINKLLLKPKCAYGCGQPGIVRFKNGRWACDKRISLCPGIQKKRSLTLRKNQARRKRLLQQEAILMSRSKIQCPHCAGVMKIQLLLGD
jgi:hypothetical protein